MNWNSIIVILGIVVLISVLVLLELRIRHLTQPALVTTETGLSQVSAETS